jgi:hypothetical protein
VGKEGKEVKWGRGKNITTRPARPQLTHKDL